MARTQHRYRCPVCGAWHWSVTYRKSITRACPQCFCLVKHYRQGTPEAADHQRQVAEALDRGYRADPDAHIKP